MKKFLFLPIFAFGLIVPEQAEAQDVVVKDSTSKVSSENKVFETMDQKPEFPGGRQGLMIFLSQNLTYPKEAEKNRIEGKVLVQFVVNRDGSIVDSRVIKSVHPLLDAEALRVVNLMPKWKPGEVKGKPVRVRYALPVTFKIPTDDLKY